MYCACEFLPVYSIHSCYICIVELKYPSKNPHSFKPMLLLSCDRLIIQSDEAGGLATNEHINYTHISGTGKILSVHCVLFQ